MVKPSVTTRLNKHIADSGLCSRREADRLIETGKVQVNRKTVIQMGTQIDPQKDKILVNGKPLPDARKFYLLFYKPKGVVTTRKDEKDRKTIYAHIPKHYHCADPAGRLDKESSGVLILSSDGDFLNRITHPRYHIPKIYRVVLTKALNEKHAKQLLTGVMLQPENKTAKMERITLTDTHTYELVLQTGHNRQIRRSFELLGYQVKNLKRTAVGPVRLGRLKPGECRPLKPSEIKSLLGAHSPA